MTNKTMMCDMETGICGEVEDSGLEFIDLKKPTKKIDLYYVTDPICSHCWALEPVFRRFMETYGHHVNLHKVMGGLLEKWHDGPIDPANGIYKPADVATHWREVGAHSRMPIDGSLMVDNPVQSSYPASRVFLQIQEMHGFEMAFAFLRSAREALFVGNSNISDAIVLQKVVNDLGINGEEVMYLAETDQAQDRLEQDFALARRLGARGFPSLVFVNEEEQGIKLSGVRAFEMYEEALERVLGEKPEPQNPKTLEKLLMKDQFLFAREIEEIYSLTKEKAESTINELDSAQFEKKEFLGEVYVIRK